MNDVISRQAAIDALEESKVRYFDRRVIIGKMQDIINGLPSAQPEVIRCGECAYRCKNWISTNEDGNVIHHCRQLDQMVEDDFYCGCAERKEG